MIKRWTFSTFLVRIICWKWRIFIFICYNIDNIKNYSWKNKFYIEEDIIIKKIVTLKCPGCGAVLSDEDKDVMFCKFCGSKLIIDNDNEYIYKNIDVADVKRVETEQLVKLQQLEMKEKENEHKKEVLKIKIISSIALAIVGIVMLRFDVIGMFPLMGSFYIWLFSMKDYSKE